MKKLSILLFILFLHLFPAKAQYVTIPDANFVTWLSQQYPSCMNSNQMDTTCTQIVNEDTVDVSYLNIAVITGVQYFDNLKYLKCNNNQLTSLPNLPVPLTFLKCDNNQLNNLPALPNALKELQCYYNQLTSLPTLPSALIYLSCHDNQLTALPSLPSSLLSLQCGNNQITIIPQLPASLHQLD